MPSRRFVPAAVRPSTGTTHAAFGAARSRLCRGFCRSVSFPVRVWLTPLLSTASTGTPALAAAAASCRADSSPRGKVTIACGFCSAIIRWWVFFVPAASSVRYWSQWTPRRLAQAEATVDRSSLPGCISTAMRSAAGWALASTSSSLAWTSRSSAPALTPPMTTRASPWVRGSPLGSFAIRLRAGASTGPAGLPGSAERWAMAAMS